MNINSVPTPCYVIDEDKLIDNLKILNAIENRTGAKILLAQKAFSAYYFYPLVGKYISGTTASGLFEARLGKEEMGKENHVFSPAYKDSEFDEIAQICDHIIFNSFTQKTKFIERRKNASCGLRINPEFSTQSTSIYDPCAKYSRLGITKNNFNACELSGIEGFHIHTLCEQNSDDLQKTVEHFEKDFGKYLKDLKWINLGGGHHITRKDYDIPLLESIVNHLKNYYGLQVYLEPGEAVALNAGYLVSEVMEIVHNDIDIAILDASAACHMPDVLEMPYRPPILGGEKVAIKKYSYRLSARTCLAGDVVGDYSFDSPLCVGDKVIFEDMAIYSMVKNNTFNGMPLPSIAVKHGDTVKIIKSFGYNDFKCRL